MGQVIAAADIGSNTAHLLIAEVKKSGIIRRVNESDWLSLGEIVSRQGRIPEDAEQLLTRSLARFQRMAKAVKAESFYVFATEAVRKAENHAEVLDRLHSKLGIQVDVIPPQREAELSLRGVLEDTEPKGRALLVETGGGSVQVALLEDGDMVEEASLPIGTGALTAKADLTQPCTPDQLDRVQQIVEQALDTLEGFDNPRKILASGGVSRGIWRSLHPDGDREISWRALDYLEWDVARLTEEEIIARYSVKAKRALTLLPGTVIYKAFLRRFGVDALQVSVFGVREGAVLEIADGRIKAS